MAAPDYHDGADREESCTDDDDRWFRAAGASAAGRARAVKVTLILCDFAQVAEGKLSVLGGGWNRKGVGTAMALGIVIEVPWSETNQPHGWMIRLVDADGHPVTTPDINGNPVELAVGGQVEVGRPPGFPAGTPQNVPLAINFGPLPLPFGQRFAFIMEIDGLSDENWQVAFSTSAPPDADEHA
jgi:hypothetical protein